MKKTQMYDRRIRQLRNNPLLMDSDDDHKIHRILQKALKIRRELRENVNLSVGRYSGLTKSELAQTGTCETDWF